MGEMDDAARLAAYDEFAAGVRDELEATKARKYDLLAGEISSMYKCQTKIMPYVMTWDGVVTKRHRIDWRNWATTALPNRSSACNSCMAARATSNCRKPAANVSIH